MPSRVCGRCPLEHACHRCFTWVGLRLSWPRRAPLTCVPPDQKSGRTAGPMEKSHLPSALGNQSELMVGDAAAWLMPPRSGLLYPLSSGHSPQQSRRPWSRLTPSPPNQKPPRPVLSPPPTSPFSSASSRGWQLFRGGSPQGQPLNIGPRCPTALSPGPLGWACQTMGAGGRVRWGIIRASSRLRENSPFTQNLTHCPFPACETKCNPDVYI